jgi:hypothetical protein
MAGYLPNGYCKPGNFKVWLSRPAETGRDAYFNSSLSTVKAGANSNATLTIYLRVLLQEKDKDSLPPVDGNKKKFPLRNWNEAEFGNYQREVKRLADEYWGGLPSSPPRFCIVPSPSIADWTGPSRIPNSN